MFNLLRFFISILFLLPFSIYSSVQDEYYGNIIKSDGAGNSYIAGNFRSQSLSFGSFTLENHGKRDIFLAKYNSNGKIIWAKSFGGSNDEELTSIDIDNSGNILLDVSSNSKVIRFENSEIENRIGRILLNAEFNSNGYLTYSKIKKQLSVTSNKINCDTTVTIVSPVQNDVWKVGTKGTITWESQNIETIKIELSLDNGTNWQLLTNSFAEENQYEFVVPNSPSDSCLIRISDFNNPEISDTSGLFTITGILYWATKEVSFNTVLTDVHSFDSNTCVVAGYNGIAKTTDGGNNWDSFLDGTGIFDIFFLDENIGWAVGFNGNFFKTTNGGNSWVSKDSGFNFHLLKVFFSDENIGFMISDRYFIKTTDGGQNWSQSQPTDHVLRAMYFINKDTGWIAGNEGVILKTTDAGSTWVSQQMNGTEYGTLTSLLFTDESTGFSTGSGLDVEGGVVLKTDNGTTWSLVHNGYNRFIYSISFSSPDSGWIVGNEGIMFNTTDGGESWELQGSGTLSNIRSIAIKSNKEGWAAGDDGIVLKYVEDSLSQPLPVELVTLNGNYKNNNIELTWSTVSESNNLGFDIERKTADKWETIGFVNGKGTTTESKSYSFIDELKNIYNGKVHYRLKQIDFDGSYSFSREIIINVINTITEFNLSQNYPNPFNPSTVIKYNVSENIHITLKVYDMLGSEVMTLVNEEKSAGSYSVSFNGSNLSSGTYFYTISAANFVQTKKMLLIK